MPGENCLDRTGEIYSTDKSVWMQGRCAWTYAYLCHLYGKRDEWMNASKSCLDFLENYCINPAAHGRLYFTVTEDGRPLRQRRYCFSEGFYAIANAEYYGLTGEKVFLERARRAYELIYQLNNGLIQDPTGLGPKTIPETRTTRALADPMIYLNIISILRRVDPEHKEEYDQRSEECVHAIVKYHYHPELRCTLESVAPDGQTELGYTAGRVVNPGHDIECSWFMMEEANYRNDQALHATAQQIFRNAIEAGWDEEYGGLLYFIDCLGKPTEAYEHDMKLWWPHNEILIASLMAYRDTKDPYYLNWFEKTWSTAKRILRMRNTANGTDICGGTESRPCLRPREVPSKVRSTCLAACRWRTNCWAIFCRSESKGPLSNEKPLSSYSRCSYGPVPPVFDWLVSPKWHS